MSNPWWRRRKKKSPWFSDIYDELERLGEMIDETMQKAFDNSSEDSSLRRNRVKGFSIKIGSDGKPKIRELHDHQSLQDEEMEFDEVEPLVDILEEEKLLVVLIALPGVDKNDIDLRVTEDYLNIKVDTEDFEWYDELNLPTRINPKSAHASYKNGVLEVKLEKLKIIRDGKLSVKK
jgi:HSP20 family protein